MGTAHRRRWPAAIRFDGRDYLTTEQVAKVLGVKPATVYAYVSRGKLTSIRMEGVDGSLFAVEEIESFATRTRRRPPAGVVERIRTRITLLDNDTLYYRGRDAVDLARSEGFESVAELLWQNRVDWSAEQAVSPSLIGGVRRLCGRQARGLDLIRMTVDAVGARDLRRHRRDVGSVTQAAASVINTAVAVLADGASGTGGTVAQRLWPALTDEPVSRRKVALLNACLVLMADHDLSAGAVAARVAASARGSVHSVIAAGLGAFDGPVHGGATTLAHRFLAGVLDDPVAAVDVELRSDTAAVPGTVPGTGHKVYRHGDPRAALILEILASAGGGDRRVMPAIATLMDTLPAGTFVNSDFALAAMALRYRMSADAAETIFALARIVGWVAHALEEYDEELLRFRPEGVYVGMRPAL